MIVYCVTHRITGRHYVGITKLSVHRRAYRHFRFSDTYFGRALRKYGLDAFEFTVVDHASDMAEAKIKESSWIAKLNSLCPNGFNLTTGGDGTTGFTHTAATKQRISESLSGHPGWMLGRQHSVETRKKLSVLLTGKRRSAEHCKKNGLSHLGQVPWNKGLTTPDDVRKKQSLAAKTRDSNRKGAHLSEAAKKHLSEINKGKTASLQTRAKMSMSQLAAWSRRKEAA
jgi:group I intron endonuclease